METASLPEAAQETVWQDRPRGIIPNRQSIEQRPAIVETRSWIGDWEADTLIGKNHRQAIVSLVERKTGFTLIRKVERTTTKAVGDAMVALLKPHHHHTARDRHRDAPIE